MDLIEKIVGACKIKKPDAPLAAGAKRQSTGWASGQTGEAGAHKIVLELPDGTQEVLAELNVAPAEGNECLIRARISVHERPILASGESGEAV